MEYSAAWRFGLRGPASVRAGEHRRVPRRLPARASGRGSATESGSGRLRDVALAVSLCDGGSALCVRIGTVGLDDGALPRTGRATLEASEHALHCADGAGGFGAAVCVIRSPRASLVEAEIVGA